MRCLVSIGKGTCLEVSIIGVTLLCFTITARAQEQGNTLATAFMGLVDDGLWITVMLSLFGGVVGLLGRLRDPRWMESARKSGIFLSVLGELTFSVFAGVFIMIYGKHMEFGNLGILTAILAGSWLGTKAGRLALAYFKEHRGKLASMIAGGTKNDPNV